MKELHHSVRKSEAVQHTLRGAGVDRKYGIGISFDEPMWVLRFQRPAIAAEEKRNLIFSDQHLMEGKLCNAAAKTAGNFGRARSCLRVVLFRHVPAFQMIWSDGTALAVFQDDLQHEL